MSEDSENAVIPLVAEPADKQNLRDRIAAVLKAANDRVAGFIGYDEMADAVIEAVLRLERGQRSNPDGPLWGSNNRYNVTRYVTEWTTDD